MPVTRPPEHTRQQILDKVAKWPDLSNAPGDSGALDNAFYATLTVDDLPTIREARRRLITGVSNESIEAYDEVSRMLMNLINVLDAYSEYRLHQRPDLKDSSGVMRRLFLSGDAGRPDSLP